MIETIASSRPHNTSNMWISSTSMVAPAVRVGAI
jgi:hypothetical protein